MRRRRPPPKDSSYSALRALAREEPWRIVELVRALFPSLLPMKARVRPAHVDDPHLDAMDADFVLRVGKDMVVHVEFQGYRPTNFSKRGFKYGAGFGLRYSEKEVHSLVIWLIRASRRQMPNEIKKGCVTIELKHVVLPDQDAIMLLQNQQTVCFAIGAKPGKLTIQQLCEQVAKRMMKGDRNRNAWRVVSILARINRRTIAWRKAVKQARQAKQNRSLYKGMTIIEEDAYRRGRKNGKCEGIKEGKVEGIKEGKVEGIKEGKNIGFVEGLQTALLGICQSRFGMLPNAIESTVNAMHSRTVLLNWGRVFSLGSLDDIATALSLPHDNPGMPTKAHAP